MSSFKGVEELTLSSSATTFILLELISGSFLATRSVECSVTMVGGSNALGAAALSAGVLGAIKDIWRLRKKI